MKTVFPVDSSCFHLMLLSDNPDCPGGNRLPQRPSAHIYVQDFAHLPSSETEARLLAIGEELEKTTAQLVVVTVSAWMECPLRIMPLAYSGPGYWE